MSTLGQKPATQHVSTEKQTITGNGGTSYTLQQSVSQASDIEVYVNNTRQEPTVAYTASGTTLTMTGAVNSSDSFYVIFQGKAIQTAGLPVDAAITASTISASQTLSVTGDLTVDTNTLHVDATNNRVGIGTASPDVALEISKNSGNSTLKLTRSNTASTDDNFGSIEFENSAGTVLAGIKGASMSGNTEAGLTFGAGGGNAERMRIDNSGNVGIGTNSPASFNTLADNLVVGTTSGENGITIATGTGNSARFVFSDNNTSSSDAFVGAIEYSHGSNSMMFYNSGSQRMVIASNGSVTNSTGSYGTISDENIKENISDASSQWNDIKALKVRKYSMKADNLDSADKIGVIAQELEKSGMNGLVEETEWTDPDDILKKDKIKTVKYSILYMKAIKALQESMARIETLEAKVTALESK